MTHDTIHTPLTFTRIQGVLMNACCKARHNASRLLRIALVLGFTAHGVSSATAQSVTVTSNHPNVVSFWNDIANRTVLAPSTVNTTAEVKAASRSS